MFYWFNLKNVWFNWCSWTDIKAGVVDTLEICVKTLFTEIEFKKKTTL